MPGERAQHSTLAVVIRTSTPELDADGISTAQIKLTPVKPLDGFISRTLTLTEHDHVLIGRSSKHRQDASPQPDNALFDCPVVSRTHAKFYTSGTDVIVSDIGSLHGTYVNGCRLLANKPHKLKNFDTISLGSDIVIGDQQYQSQVFQIGMGKPVVVDLSSPTSSPVPKAPPIWARPSLKSTFIVPDLDEDMGEDTGEDMAEDMAEDMEEEERPPVRARVSSEASHSSESRSPSRISIRSTSSDESSMASSLDEAKPGLRDRVKNLLNDCRPSNDEEAPSLDIRPGKEDKEITGTSESDSEDEDEDLINSPKVTVSVPAVTTNNLNRPASPSYNHEAMITEPASVQRGPLPESPSFLPIPARPLATHMTGGKDGDQDSPSRHQTDLNYICHVPPSELPIYRPQSPTDRPASQSLCLPMPPEAGSRTSSGYNPFQNSYQGSAYSRPLSPPPHLPTFGPYADCTPNASVFRAQSGYGPTCSGCPPASREHHPFFPVHGPAESRYEFETMAPRWSSFEMLPPPPPPPHPPAGFNPPRPFAPSTGATFYTPPTGSLPSGHRAESPAVHFASSNSPSPAPDFHPPSSPVAVSGPAASESDDETAGVDAPAIQSPKSAASPKLSAWPISSIIDQPPTTSILDKGKKRTIDAVECEIAATECGSKEVTRQTDLDAMNIEKAPLTPKASVSTSSIQSPITTIAEPPRKRVRIDPTPTVYGTKRTFDARAMAAQAAKYTLAGTIGGVVAIGGLLALPSSMFT